MRALWHGVSPSPRVLGADSAGTVSTHSYVAVVALVTSPQELEAMKAEFSGVQERTAKAAARWEARKKELEAKKEEEVVQEHFKANPVPKYLRKGNRAA